MNFEGRRIKSNDRPMAFVYHADQAPAGRCIPAEQVDAYLSQGWTDSPAKLKTSVSVPVPVPLIAAPQAQTGTADEEAMKTYAAELIVRFRALPTSLKKAELQDLADTLGVDFQTEETKDELIGKIVMAIDKMDAEAAAV